MERWVWWANGLQEFKDALKKLIVWFLSNRHPIKCNFAEKAGWITKNWVPWRTKAKPAQKASAGSFSLSTPAPLASSLPLGRRGSCQVDLGIQSSQSSEKFSFWNFRDWTRLYCLLCCCSKRRNLIGSLVSDNPWVICIGHKTKVWVDVALYKHPESLSISLCDREEAIGWLHFEFPLFCYGKHAQGKWVHEFYQTEGGL